MTSTDETAADPMWEQAYMDVQKVLDKALGTEEDAGAGAGIAADVWLLASQRNSARRRADRAERRLAELTQPGLFPLASADGEGGERVPGAEVGVAMIRAERLRQIAVEGHTPEHDAQHDRCELALAGGAYAMSAAGSNAMAEDMWPFGPDEFKRGGWRDVGDLVKAGALIAAEIDRIVAEASPGEH